MKTIFKSLLYFSFAGLILTGCAKNDDFSVPTINCNEPNVKATTTTDNLYLTVNSKEIQKYTKDETISGIVISSDQGGNFYQQLYIVDEETQTPVTLKVDVKGGFALYPVGSKVFVKLKDTYIQNSYGMITIGGGITSNGKYVDVLTGSKLRTSLFKSCKVLTGDKFNKYINVVTIDQLKTDTKLYGKLIRVVDVQFDRAAVGKTYYEAGSSDNDAQGQTLRKMVDKKGSSLVVRTSQYADGFKNQIVSDKSGMITGIVSDFQGTIQFYPRTMEDMKLDKDPFDGGTTEPEGPNEGKDVDGVDQNTPTFVANFSNWSSFILATNKYGVMSYAKEAKGQGKDGKGAMAIKGTPAGNDYVYTIENQTVSKGAKTISMWIKGTSAKSLSFNVFKADGSYAVFNLATDVQIEGKEKPVYSKDLNLTATKRMNSTNPKNGNNDYVTGSVNASDWIKITLDLTGVDYNTTGKGSLFAFKVGSKVAYDLLVSDIVFDGGKDDGGTVEPGDEELAATQKTSLGNMLFMGADFSKAEDFAKISIDRNPVINLSKVEGGVMKVTGKATGNGYLITAQNSTTHFAEKGKKSIVMKMRGTAKGKSLSVNVYAANGVDKNQFNENYHCYNFGDITKSTSIDAVKGNNYGGSIDTKGEWIEVTLNIPDSDYYRHADKAIFSIKVGKDGDYNLEIDSITLK